MVQALGLDIGGTGIKGSIVDVTTGELIGERFQLPTPQPTTVDDFLQITRPRRRTYAKPRPRRRRRLHTPLT